MRLETGQSWLIGGFASAQPEAVLVVVPNRRFWHGSGMADRSGITSGALEALPRPLDTWRK